MFNPHIAIDLGTCNTIIYVNHKGIIFNEPTVIAVNEVNNHTYAVGYEAAKLIGRTPQGIKIIHPLKNGVIADLDATIQFISTIFNLTKYKRHLKRSKIIITAPSELTPVEENALKQLGKKLGASKLVIENKAKMAAIGSDLDVNSPKGAMIVDIGGGTTDVVVLSVGKVVVSKSIPNAGLLIDEAIIRYMRATHNIKIGEKNAEYIKMKIGSVGSDYENRLLQVSGVSIETSLPHSVIITTQAISEVISPIVKDIVDCVRDILFITPPELAGDIVENGISLTGGVSLLSGLRETLEKELNVPVRLTSDPLLSAIEGCHLSFKNI
ncbi:MAG: rod shape-determining protein [Erysipelotrichales bacterium]|nr:rod shape-determining protein [Erysipelotrichales bacterium]